MTTRGGCQYSIQSDCNGIRSRVDPSKGKRKGKITSGTESTQGSAISQWQVPEMPIISKAELELIQNVLHSVQGQGLEIVATNPPRSDEILAHPDKMLQRGGNSEIPQWMESTIIQASNQKDKGVPCQKEGGKQGRSPSSFYQKASSQPTSLRREQEQEKEWRKPYYPSNRIPKIQKDAMDNVFKMARSLMEFKDKEEQRMSQPHFPKK
ncbi:hypothetical protein O181_051756 [Austropuccinia psidii MF-1]|uniref:Uncharacterized protein n=1 Tax=Austropuccinia psidii MF-1 TaxID=1389203 RepID=A0A9Q3DX18_9BASI|nr:hypothetical protein [Austropuccinia psidii MF-1]